MTDGAPCSRDGLFFVRRARATLPPFATAQDVAMEAEGHKFSGGDACQRCGMSRKAYDNSTKPNPCVGYRNQRIPDGEPIPVDSGTRKQP